MIQNNSWKRVSCQFVKQATTGWESNESPNRLNTGHTAPHSHCRVVIEAVDRSQLLIEACHWSKRVVDRSKSLIESAAAAAAAAAAADHIIVIFVPERYALCSSQQTGEVQVFSWRLVLCQAAVRWAATDLWPSYRGGISCYASSLTDWSCAWSQRWLMEGLNASLSSTWTRCFRFRAS